MVGFKITVNGKRYCESDDISVVTMVAEHIRRRSGYRISLHAGSGDGPLQWLAADLKVDDEIVIRVTDMSEIEEGPSPACSFCARPVHEVSKLIQGPDTAICDGCIKSLSTAVRNATELPAGASIRDDPDSTCGFCSNQPSNAVGVIVRNGATICPECLRVCSDMVAESGNNL